MRPTDIDFRRELNDPSWDIAALDYLIAICEEKKRQIWNSRNKS